MTKWPDKPITVEVNGSVLGWFKSVSDTARFFNRTVSTIIYRIQTGNAVKGLLFRYATDSDLKYPCLSLQKEKKTKKKAVIEPPPVQKPIPEEEKKEEPEEEEVFLDRDKYTIIPYQTRFARICITPCPFKTGNDRPYVGSAKCEQCSSFRGRNRKSKEIACRRSINSYERKD